MAKFKCITEIEADVQVVFDLARDIDAHTRSLSHSNEKAIDGVTSGLINLGESVTWQATHFKIPFKMTSKIVEMDPPNCFVDEQTKGPFKRFRHIHLFKSADNGTLMVDEIDFDSPAGFIGRIVDHAVLGDYMEKLIRQRNNELKNEAEKLHKP